MLIALLILGLATFAMIPAIASARIGYEDETGFHEGLPPSGRSPSRVIVACSPEARERRAPLGQTVGPARPA